MQTLSGGGCSDKVAFQVIVLSCLQQLSNTTWVNQWEGWNAKCSWVQPEGTENSGKGL